MITPDFCHSAKTWATEELINCLKDEDYFTSVKKIKGSKQKAYKFQNDGSSRYSFSFEGVYTMETIHELTTRALMNGWKSVQVETSLNSVFPYFIIHLEYDIV